MPAELAAVHEVSYRDAVASLVEYRSGQVCHDGDLAGSAGAGWYRTGSGVVVGNGHHASVSL